MKTQPTEQRASDPRQPLLRAIQREISERRSRLYAAESILEAFLPTRRHHPEEVARLQSEVSLQRRELRQVARELSRLGVPFDAENPHTLIACEAAEGGSDRHLDGTGFFRRMAEAQR